MPRSDDWCAFSVRQPYAHFIAVGLKNFESRSWPVETGAVLLHASQSLAAGWRQDPVVQAALEYLSMATSEVLSLPRGAIIGRTVVKEVIDPSNHKKLQALKLSDRFFCAEEGDIADNYIWKLERSRPFARPAKCDGRLYIWPVPPKVLAKLSSSKDLN